MMLSDPFGRPDEPGDPPGRRHARLACRLVGGALAVSLVVGERLAPLQCEPFMVLGVVLMLVAMLLSYVL